ncbi:hypothetical protein WJX79_008461 [Trebouxia sp. C0005]
MVVQRVLGFRNVNDPRNGLLLAKAVKEKFDDIPTFVALQGKRLLYEGDQRPFKRCLAFQARQNRHSAVAQGHISPSDLPEVDGSAGSQCTCMHQIKDYLADQEICYEPGPPGQVGEHFTGGQY